MHRIGPAADLAAPGGRPLPRPSRCRIGARRPSAHRDPVRNLRGREDAWRPGPHEVPAGGTEGVRRGPAGRKL